MPKLNHDSTTDLDYIINVCLPFYGHPCSLFFWGTFLDKVYHSLDSASLSHVSLRPTCLGNLLQQNGLLLGIKPFLCIGKKIGLLYNNLLII